MILRRRPRPRFPPAEFRCHARAGGKTRGPGVLRRAGHPARTRGRNPAGQGTDSTAGAVRAPTAVRRTRRAVHKGHPRNGLVHPTRTPQGYTYTPPALAANILCRRGGWASGILHRWPVRVIRGRSRRPARRLAGRSSCRAGAGRPGSPRPGGGAVAALPGANAPRRGRAGRAWATGPRGKSPAWIATRWSCTCACRCRNTARR